MKIALISSPFVEVPPRNYGGTERIVHYLGEKLLEFGEEVTIYAPGESSTAIPLKPICDIALFNDPAYNHATDRAKRMREVNSRTLELLDRTSDVINVHDYDNPDLIGRLSKLDIPVVVSFGHAVTPLIREVYGRFRNLPNIHFHGLSKNQLQSLDPALPHIYNGIDQEVYEPSRAGPRAPYFFSIGDMKPIKAHKTAIRVAREAGLDLVIAGAPYYPESKPYFEREVVPHIDLDLSSKKSSFLEALQSGSFPFDKGKIIYFGPATDKEKTILYQHANCMQFLGNLEVQGNIEACPTTILESLLLGTPVLGVKGSVTSELVEDNKTGINVASSDEAVEALSRMAEIPESGIRDEGLRRFSSEVMAENYLKFYRMVIGGN